MSVIHCLYIECVNTLHVYMMCPCVSFLVVHLHFWDLCIYMSFFHTRLITPQLKQWGVEIETEIEYRKGMYKYLH